MMGHRHRGSKLHSENRESERATTKHIGMLADLLKNRSTSSNAQVRDDAEVLVHLLSTVRVQSTTRPKWDTDGPTKKAAQFVAREMFNGQHFAGVERYTNTATILIKDATLAGRAVNEFVNLITRGLTRLGFDKESDIDCRRRYRLALNALLAAKNISMQAIERPDNRHIAPIENAPFVPGYVAKKPYKHGEKHHKALKSLKRRLAASRRD